MTTPVRMKHPVSCKDVPSTEGSSYPSSFLNVVQGRSKAKLGDFFGLTNFGVNYTTLQPGASSALFHYHSKQDEFILILEGKATLYFGDSVSIMQAGDCMGFPAAEGVAHRLANESSTERVVYIEIGDRTSDDEVEYPDHDLRAVPENDGSWKFTHKDGTPYE